MEYLMLLDTALSFTSKQGWIPKEVTSMIRQGKRMLF